jgi:hypothetical protein
MPHNFCIHVCTLSYCCVNRDKGSSIQIGYDPYVGQMGPSGFAQPICLSWEESDAQAPPANRLHMHLATYYGLSSARSQACVWFLSDAFFSKSRTKRRSKIVPNERTLLLRKKDALVLRTCKGSDQGLNAYSQSHRA